MRDDRLMVIYCPVNGVPVLGHVTTEMQLSSGLAVVSPIRTSGSSGV